MSDMSIELCHIKFRCGGRNFQTVAKESRGWYQDFCLEASVDISDWYSESCGNSAVKCVNFSARYWTMLVMLYHSFCVSAAMNLHILFVHAGMTGRYHNELLDSLITILLYGSFLSIVISIYFYFMSVLSCVMLCYLFT